LAKNYMEILKKRAKAFLEIAEHDYSRGYYDLVLFHVEQFLQLYLKYLLYRRIGDFPKTHLLIRLFKDVLKVYDNEDLKRFYEENLEILYLLEEAYISSRYIPREYDEEIDRRILDFSKKALEVLEWLERH